MADQSSELKFFNSGVHNLLDDTIIPADAASDEKNWFTQYGRIGLIGGRAKVGAEGLTGMITGEIFGYKVDGSTVHWRKAGANIQYFDGSAWQTVIAGLTVSADYAFTNYSSLAGTFTYFFGIDGIFKVHNAILGSYISLFDATKNFKGKAFINKGRSILWDRTADKTGVYGSWIDNQQAVAASLGVYTAVAGEATTSLTGTLAFKAGGATRNCFGVTITLTGTGEVYTDAYLGVLSGSLGGTGTINYITGAYTLSNAGVGTAAYQWENSNLRGVTDFSHSATRVASEGFQFPQDDGGDAILNILIGQDNAYYSLKKKSVYRLFIADDDTAAGTTNEVYYKNMGIQSWRGAISTQIGIVFMNTANPEKPELTLLKKNPIGDNIIPQVLFSQFDFSNYVWSDCTLDTYDVFITIACRSLSSSFNDVVLLGEVEAKKIDITYYPVRTFAKDSGILYVGSSVSLSSYKLYNGYDDVGLSIDNFWIGRGELFQSKTKIGSKPTSLKKHRRLRFKGLIDPNQSYAVYVNYDDAGAQLVGTVLGSGSYVDYSSPQSIGSNVIGGAEIGGDDTNPIYPYFVEIRIKKPPKFLKRKIQFIALGIGYVDISYQNDWGLMFYEDKIPARFRQKQNVSIDGATTDMANPEF